jgi:hypothetical protein
MSDASRSWPPFAALGLTALVLVGVPWAFKLLTAPKLGEPCGHGFDCAALDGRCVLGEHGGYCTRTCEDDPDCPASGHCGVPPHDPWQRWFASSELSERFCVPGPRPDQPLERTEAMPGTEAGAQFRPPEQRGGLGGSKLERDKR